jgi:hypothetical protein
LEIKKSLATIGWWGRLAEQPQPKAISTTKDTKSTKKKGAPSARKFDFDFVLFVSFVVVAPNQTNRPARRRTASKHWIAALNST